MDWHISSMLCIWLLLTSVPGDSVWCSVCPIIHSKDVLWLANKAYGRIMMHHDSKPFGQSQQSLQMNKASVNGVIIGLGNGFSPV